MDRKEALTLTVTILGTGLVGSHVFLAGCSNLDKSGLSFTKDDIAFLDEVGETILPHSDQSPGAKAAQIGEFMKTMATDCYGRLEAQIFSI